jgi:hypothetical protein
MPLPTPVSGVGTVWNLPNFSGQLYTASYTDTPLLTLIGGAGGMRAKRTNNFEFAIDSEYALPDPLQPEISETASLTAPIASEIVRTQNTNVTQIFHQRISLSYCKESNGGRLSGINTAGQANNVGDELTWQTQRALEILARNIEYTFINGTYSKATSSATVNKTRGMFAAITEGGTAIDADDAPLSKQLLDQVLLASYTNGARFRDLFVFVNGYQKLKLTDAYNIVNGFNLPPDRNFGGLNITRVETDFTTFNIVLSKYIPADSLLGVDISVVSPVEQFQPGKGNFFREALAKTGASDDYQIFGQIGLDHGPEFMHFSITGLESTFPSS